jgi:hypothetical protein
MQNTCINRKGKQRKSSGRRGARKENWPKRAKKTAVAGNRTLHHLQIRSIYGGLPFIRRIYTVGPNPYTVIRLRNWRLSVIYGTGYTAYRGYGVYTVIRFGPTLHIHSYTRHTTSPLSCGVVAGEKHALRRCTWRSYASCVSPWE